MVNPYLPLIAMHLAMLEALAAAALAWEQAVRPLAHDLDPSNPEWWRRHGQGAPLHAALVSLAAVPALPAGDPAGGPDTE